MSDTSYPENEGQTHFDGCYLERGHHNCAVREIIQLQAERDALRKQVQELETRLAHKK